MNNYFESYLLKEANLRLNEILELVIDADIDAPGLGTGNAGLLVLLADAYCNSGNQELIRPLRRVVRKIICSVAVASLGPDLYSGLSGIAWAVRFAADRCGYDLLRLDEGACSEIDSVLLSALSIDAGKRHYKYELLYGLVGIGVYALSLLPNSCGVDLYQKVVARLHSIAVTTPSGKTWLTLPEDLPGGPVARAKYPSGNYNLGIAHGIPGVVALLGIAAHKRLASAADLDLLSEAVRWLTEESCRDQASRYGYVSGDFRVSRTAWCYGDLSVSVALTYAALGLKDRNLLQRAYSLALATSRRSEGDGGVVDACICHGSAGISHLNGRLYLLSGLNEFRALQFSWIESALTQTREACASLSTSSDTDYGYLSGLIGIGLALQSFTSVSSSDWDTPLMCSFPERKDCDIENIAEFKLP